MMNPYVKPAGPPLRQKISHFFVDQGGFDIILLERLLEKSSFAVNNPWYFTMETVQPLR